MNTKFRESTKWAISGETLTAYDLIGILSKNKGATISLESGIIDRIEYIKDPDNEGMYIIITKQ